MLGVFVAALEGLSEVFVSGVDVGGEPRVEGKREGGKGNGDGRGKEGVEVLKENGGLSEEKGSADGKS